MANAILKNEEVEALLAAIETGQVLVGQKVETKKDKKIQHYDFRRPDRFPREQKRRLQKSVRKWQRPWVYRSPDI